MIPLEFQVTSTEIGQLLTSVTKRKSKSALALANIVGAKFDRILDLAQQDEKIRLMVHDFNITSKLTGNQVNRFCRLVLRAIEQPAQNSGDFEGEMEMDDREDFGSPELAKLALSIRILYSTTWYAKSKVGDFSSAGQEYIDTFLKFYGDEEDVGDKEGTVKTKNKKSGKNKKEEKWKESQDDEYGGFVKVGDMIIVKTIFAMLQSYLDALLRKMGNPGTTESIQSALRKEVDDGRWPALAKIVEKLKKLPFQHTIIDNLDEFDYSFENIMDTLLEGWDSYAIQMEDSQENK